MHKKLILYHYFYARPTDTENRDRLQQGAGVKASNSDQNGCVWVYFIPDVITRNVNIIIISKYYG